MNLAIWGVIYSALSWFLVVWYSQFPIGQTNTGALNGGIAISTSLLYYNGKLKPSILTESTFNDLNNEMWWIGVFNNVIKGQKTFNNWALYKVYHRRWSWEIEKYFHPTHYNGSKYLSMLGLKLNHVSKRGLLVLTSKHYTLLNQGVPGFFIFVFHFYVAMRSSTMRLQSVSSFVKMLNVGQCISVTYPFCLNR